MAVTLGLMVLKVFTWLAIVRLHSILSLSSLFLLFAVLMFWSYARAMHSRPVNIMAKDSSTKQVKRYCERCDAEKAEHVHHCSVCQRCVYRMDHHCPWTGNCVAWSNKKFFLLFLIYTSVSCLLFTTMASTLVWDANFHTYKALLWFGYIMSLSIGLLLFGYFIFHLWLLREGKTTLEYLAGKRGELADCTFKHNVTVYFGRNVWSWWLPTTPLLDATMRGKEYDDDDDEDEMVQLVVI